MRGGSQAHLLRASDNHFYVTKFQNNPQAVRILANEYLAAKLGQALGLSMPEVRIIEVSEWLIQNSPELKIDELNRRISAASVAQNWPEARRYIDELRTAVQGLAAIGGTEVTKAIGDALADSAEGFEHRKFAETEQLREAAITALAGLGNDAMPVIERGVRDSRPAVRIAFGRALEEVRRSSESHTK
jgi:hypothetical protein